MSDQPEDLLYYEDLSPEQAEALRQALETDPELRRALARWQRLRAGVCASLAAHVPDRAMLVRYALAEVRPELLDEGERSALAAARPALERALRAHPALGDVVRHVQGSCTAFDEAWATCFAAGRAEDRPPAARASARRWAARTALGLALVAFAALAVLLVQRDRSLVTVRTGEGEVRIVELGDGSVVRLLGSSVFSFADPSRAAAFERHARLVGRAFFDIAPAQHGFVVETPTARATVLGTRFGVQADEAVTEVVLAQGRLTLAPKAAPDQMVVLAPGQASRVAAHALPTTPAAVDLAQGLEWTGLFVFESTPVQQIADLLRTHFARPVAVDPALADEEVTGTFEQDRPLREILDVIAATLGAEVRPQDGDGFLLAPAGAM